MRLSQILSRSLRQRFLFVHPPEPRKEYLISRSDEGVYIGKTKWMAVPFYWSPQKLINPHIAVMGITGSGKSYLLKSFLTRAAIIWNANAVILDWVGEYNKFVKQVGGRVVSLGKEHLNLLDLGGVSKEERIKQILSSFQILLNLKHHQEEYFEIEDALELAYKKREPTLKDVYRVLVKKKSKAARLLKKFINVGSDFFAGRSTLKLDRLINSGIVCIDLHTLPNEEMRSLAGLTVLQFIKEKMRASGAEEKKGIKLFVVLDEAWKIASDERSDVITIVREGRKYNFALVVASQNPTDIHKTIFSNVGTTFVLRTVLKEFRDYVRGSLMYSDYIEQEMSNFSVGDAAVHMIFSDKSKTSTFVLDKIDGEEPLFVLSIRGDGVNVEIEKDQLSRMLIDAGLSDEQVEKIRRKMEAEEGSIDAHNFVEMLILFGLPKQKILSFMRELGVEEHSTISIFSFLKKKKAFKGTAELVLE